MSGKADASGLVSKIWYFDSMGYTLHGHLNSFLGKNLSLYLPIRAWFMIALVAHVHRKFE